MSGSSPTADALTDAAAFDVVLGLLRDAAAAHGVYEAEQLGGAYDEGWPEWYARRMVDRLRESGYALARADI